MQQYAVYILLQYHSTRFGCHLHLSSGVHKTVVTATGTSHMVVQLSHSNVANGCGAVRYLHTYDLYRCLKLQFYVLLMMGVDGTRNM